MSNITIRPANINDCETILQFVIDLAVYEKARNEVLADQSHIRATLFSEDPKAFCLICEIDGQPVGFAVYFYNYSTWLGKHGVYLEDLYVAPERRGSGAGKALLKELASIAIKNKCGRLEWSVLDWNEPAIKFYEAMGAKPQDGWTVYRLTGDSLLEFAE